MEKILNYINGELVEPGSNSFIENYEPATGKVYSMIPDSDEKDVAIAASAAKDAFPAWSTMPKEKRSSIILNIVKLIKENIDDLAMAESKDNGKPFWLAKQVDIPRAAKNFQFFATGDGNLRRTHAGDFGPGGVEKID